MSLWPPHADSSGDLSVLLPWDLFGDGAVGSTGWKELLPADDAAPTLWSAAEPVDAHERDAIAGDAFYKAPDADRAVPSWPPTDGAGVLAGAVATAAEEPHWGAPPVVGDKQVVPSLSVAAAAAATVDDAAVVAAIEDLWAPALGSWEATDSDRTADPRGDLLGLSGTSAVTSADGGMLGGGGLWELPAEGGVAAKDAGSFALSLVPDTPPTAVSTTALPHRASPPRVAPSPPPTNADAVGAVATRQSLEANPPAAAAAATPTVPTRADAVATASVADAVKAGTVDRVATRLPLPPYAPPATARGSAEGVSPPEWFPSRLPTSTIRRAVALTASALMFAGRSRQRAAASATVAAAAAAAAAAPAPTAAASVARGWWAATGAVPPPLPSPPTAAPPGAAAPVAAAPPAPSLAGVPLPVARRGVTKRRCANGRFTRAP